MRNVLVSAVAGVALLSAGGCNLFGTMAPTTDAQRLSVARACFDQGDYECAREYYTAITDTTVADEVIAETALMTLDDAGVGLKMFGTLITSAAGGGSTSSSSASGGSSSSAAGGTGGMLTSIAAVIKDAGEAQRVKIFDAYKAADKISSTGLKGLVQFLASFALIGEILAEDAGVDGKPAFSADDMVVDSTKCKALTQVAAPTATLLIQNAADPTVDMFPGQCAEKFGANSCAKATGAKIVVGTSVNLADMTTIAGDPSFYMLIAAISAS
ncbi:MAG: hypothetical protein AAB425_02720, partial [Bdellovibrionota bacterium]